VTSFPSRRVPARAAQAGVERAPLPVLLVEDSAVARAVLTRLIDQSGDFYVAHSVGTVGAALSVLANHRVSFILLDIALPGIDGLTALPDLIAAARGGRVLIVSSSASDGASTTLQALAMGAADTLLKPASGDSTEAFGTLLLEKLRRLGEPGRPAPLTRPIMRSPRPLTPVANAFSLIAIGASTGGIHALGLLFRALPRSFQTPILVTQHLPASFMPYFAAQLAVLSGRPCDVASDRLRIRPGRVVVAPGDAHMRGVALSDGSAAIRLNSDPVSSGCLPSVDPMFASLAAVYRERLLAVVLSGMGRDGAEGAVAVASAGGCVIVQDEASSVVWGMPGAVAATGAATAMLTPEALGEFIASGHRS
jgi:two-component system chemotaxis response regulator CheB